MNITLPHELNPLPASIEVQLANLEARHKAHQHMLEGHKEARYQRRKRHREGWHKIKNTAQVLP